MHLSTVWLVSDVQDSSETQTEVLCRTGCGGSGTGVCIHALSVDGGGEHPHAARPQGPSTHAAPPRCAAQQSAPPGHHPSVPYAGICNAPPALPAGSHLRHASPSAAGQRLADTAWVGRLLYTFRLAPCALIWRGFLHHIGELRLLCGPGDVWLPIKCAPTHHLVVALTVVRMGAARSKRLPKA